MKRVPDANPNMMPCKKMRPPKFRVVKLDRISEAPEVHTPTSPTFRTPYRPINQDACQKQATLGSNATLLVDRAAYRNAEPGEQKHL